MTSNSCFICSNLLIECRGKDDGQVLKKKVSEKLESVSRTRQDSIHNLLKDLPPKSTVWVKNSCYKKYTDKQKRFREEQVATNSSPQNLLEVNVHTITEHTVLFLKKN